MFWTVGDAMDGSPGRSDVRVQEFLGGVFDICGTDEPMKIRERAADGMAHPKRVALEGEEAHERIALSKQADANIRPHGGDG